MKVVFNGILEKVSSGCNCKGKKSKFSYVKSKGFHLPSGVHKTFVEGKVEEVSDRDGAFLLKYSYVDANGVRRDVFSEVK